MSFFFYKKIGDNDDGNNYSSSYYYYHLAYADSSGGKSFNVTIPKGSANPEVDITKLGPRQWYFPRQITVHTDETIKWINQDTEAHTVTSGVGAGIESLMNNKRGTSNGIFDSGLFKTGESWTHTFTNPGTYTYFCTIHPWMEGIAIITIDRKFFILFYNITYTFDTYIYRHCIKSEFDCKLPEKSNPDYARLSKEISN